jgi:FlaA1/EpsC-like NDP-sugar epimerase
VLFLDIFILAFSVLSTRILLLDMGMYFAILQNFKEITWSGVITMNVLFFFVFKTYAGIIRHSSFIDGIKLFVAQGVTCLVLFFLNWYIEQKTGIKLLLNTGLVIYFSFSFVYLFLYRIFVKFIFDHFLSIQSQIKTRAIVLGVDANSIAIANALMMESPARFKILGFIDPYQNNTSKRILNVPIYSMPKRISVLMRNMQAEALVLADNSLSKQQKNQIVDDCLEYNFKVFVSPMVTNWEKSAEISKKIKKFEIHDLLERKEIVLDKKGISKQLHNKVVMVTGAAGSIGSEIARQVLQFQPKMLLLLDQAESPLHDLHLELKKLSPKMQLVPVLADVRRKGGMQKIFEQYRPEVVYHAAAYKHVPLMEDNPKQAIFTNVLGTKIVADLACKYQVNSFVMVSTDKAVNPSNVMGASKRIAECYVRHLHQVRETKGCSTKFITTRFGNVLGSNGSVVPLFTKQIQEGGPITITHPEIIRFFMTIPEACQLVLEAGSMGNGGEIFIFDMGEPVKIIDLAKKMIKLAGYVPYKDIDIQVVGLRPGEKLFEELLNDKAKTLPTYHQKIMIATEEETEISNLNQHILELIQLAKNLEEELIVQKMKQLVPEFLSKNSKFQSLDTLN